MSYEAPILILQMAIVLSVPAAAVYVSSISMSMRIEQACPFTACPCSSLRLTQVCRSLYSEYSECSKYRSEPRARTRQKKTQSKHSKTE